MLRYTVLASGSRANCAVIDHNGKLLLIDCGLGPVVVKRRFATLGLDWNDVHALIVTHTHGDHINIPTFKKLPSQTTIWCHDGHKTDITEVETVEYKTGVPFVPIDGMKVIPIALWHDSPSTHGFRIDVQGLSIGHVADTGAWTQRMARLLAGVDLMAIEANHDVDMQLRSDRPSSLIERNLSNYGHLSNDQCVAFLKEIADRGKPPLYNILLHMSHSCNDQDKIATRVKSMFGHSVVAMQDEPTEWFKLVD